MTVRPIVTFLAAALCVGAARDSLAQERCAAEHRCVRVLVATQSQTVLSLLSATSTSLLTSVPGGFATLDISTGAVTITLARTQDCAGATRSLFYGGTFYWLSSSGICAAAFGETPRRVLSYVFPYVAIGSFAVSSSQLYATVRVGDDFQIQRVATTGGTPSLVETLPGGGTAIATNSRFVFWSNGGVIHYCTPSGSPIRVTGTSLGHARSMVADESSVYMATGTAILRVDITTGASTVLVSHGASGLVLDGLQLYWFRSDVGDIGRVSIGGGGATTLAVAPWAPDAIVISATSVFYVEGQHDQTIRVITPK